MKVTYYTDLLPLTRKDARRLCLNWQVIQLNASEQVKQVGRRKAPAIYMRFLFQSNFSLVGWRLNVPHHRRGLKLFHGPTTGPSGGD